MTTGLILLVFLGLLLAYAWARTRRRLGMATSGRAYLWAVAAVVLLGLALWAYSTRR